MAGLDQGLVGVQSATRLPDSPTTLVSARYGSSGEKMVSNLNPFYYEMMWRGKLFHATLPIAGVALTVSGTAAGFALANPAGSGINVAIVYVSVAPVSGTFVLGPLVHGVNTAVAAAAVTGTAITAIPGLAGSAFTASAKAFSAATLPAAPTPLYPFGVKTPTPATVQYWQLSEYVDGRIGLAPGATWTLFEVGTDTTPLQMASVSWVEIPA